MKVYYKPHASRNNLTVLTSAHVARVSLEKLASGGAIAKSVSFLHEGNEYLALVKREVIISAGYASRSPQDKGKTLTSIWPLQNSHVPTGRYSYFPIGRRASYKRRSWSSRASVTLTCCGKQALKWWSTFQVSGIMSKNTTTWGSHIVRQFLLSLSPRC